MASEYYINSYRDLAANAIEDLKNYANDEGPERLMVSYRGYKEDLERLDNTGPVAPVSPDATGKCGELETVARQYRWGGDPKWKPFGPIFDDEPRETRELVTRSQAVELLAAERAKADEYYGEAVVSYDRKLRIEELEAKLAAAEKALEEIASDTYGEEGRNIARAALGGKPS